MPCEASGFAAKERETHLQWQKRCKACKEMGCRGVRRLGRRLGTLPQTASSPQPGEGAQKGGGGRREREREREREGGYYRGKGSAQNSRKRDAEAPRG